MIFFFFFGWRRKTEANLKVLKVPEMEQKVNKINTLILFAELYNFVTNYIILDNFFVNLKISY